MPKKEKIPAPGAKSDQYTNFMNKKKWKQALSKANVDISGRNLRGQGALIAGTAVVKSKFVTNVDFSGNHFGDHGAIEFAQCLKVNDMLTTVNLSCNEITDVGGIALASAFIPSANPSGQPGQWNRSVSSMNLSGNQLKDDTLFAWCNAAACHIDLYQVDMQYNQIGPNGCKGLMRMMQRNVLCNFILHHNKIGDEGTQLLAAAWKAFGKTGSQNRLNLSCNDIAKGGAEALGELCANNDFVVDLNLAWNTIGEKGMQLFTLKLSPFAGGPQPKTVLTELNLSYCKLNDGGAMELAKLIALDIETLVKLNASKNDINDAGGQALGQALGKNTHLQQINFSENEFGDKTANALVASVGETKSIQRLTVRKCGFTTSQADLVRSVNKTPAPQIDLGRDEVMLSDFLDKISGWMEAHKPDENAGKKKKGKGKGKGKGK